jgi:hypothetical protein
MTNLLSITGIVRDEGHVTRILLELLYVPERGLEYLAAVATPYALLVYRGNHCGGP